MADGQGEADFGARLARVEERIDGACRRCGRRREEVRLMAVSKFHSREAVEEARARGVTLFGENRVREGIDKFTGLAGPGGAEVHLIGTLQRNKVRAAAGFFHCVQSVDREALIDALGRACAERESPLPILLELHTGEESKAGFPGLDALLRGAERALSYPGLAPRGLMTMAPYVGEAGDQGPVRASFRALRRAREDLARRFPAVAWDCLSMGMSGDFEIAIEEGSTLIRVGTALFGERRP